ncbi:MAG: hypothetical protein AAF527_00595 [Pseudomonadota bacterium]
MHKLDRLLVILGFTIVTICVGLGGYHLGQADALGEAYAPSRPLVGLLIVGLSMALVGTLAESVSSSIRRKK